MKSAVIALVFLASSLAPAQDTHGVQVQNIDHTVKPGDDFFHYANGAWIARTVLPADRVAISAFSIIADHTDHQLTAIFDDVTKKSGSPGSNNKKIADLYASFMDEATLDRRGLEPVRGEMATIAAVKTKAELARMLGMEVRNDTDALNNTNFHTMHLFGVWVAPGFQDPDHYAAYLMQGGDFLPSQQYYLSDSAAMKEIREKYRAHIAAMLKLAGVSDIDAKVDRILDLETKIAKVQLPLEECEDIHRANNLWKKSEFVSQAPGLDWTAFFAGAELSTEQMYVWQADAIKAESALVASEPLDAWKDWMMFHLLEEHPTALNKAISDEWFAFNGVTLSGAKAQLPRDRRARAEVQRELGDAVSELYVGRYFSPEAKAQAEAMVKNLLDAFHKRLEAITWMAPETKAEALRKLGTLHVSVGYPDHWRSYAGLEIRKDDLYGNMERSSLFEYHYQLSRIGKPTDRSEWCMQPTLVNAVNLPLDNGLNFPAAILQAPFFDAQAPAASNYGAIGAIMGHEISHTFDSEGAAFDSQGKVRNWWTDADLAHFKAATAALAAQYDQYEVLPGVHVNGKQTLGEDIADLGGIAASFDAFHESLHGKDAPVLNGLNGDQQFFLAFGQAWQSKYREATLRRLVATDPHAPAQFRADTVRNSDAWYAAFDVKPGETLYLTPEQRVRIW